MNYCHIGALTGLFIQIILKVVANETSVMPHVTVSCKCGVTSLGFRSKMIDRYLSEIDTKIVNGQVIQETAHPHLALLLKRDPVKKTFYHKCGGTIINNKYVLTAAHCFGETKRELIGVRKSDWKVKLGVHNKLMKSEGITYSVKQIITHKKYHKVNDEGGLDNDIALLKLNNLIPFTPLIRPACLPTPGVHNYSTNGVVQGWGKTESGAGSLKPRKATLQVLSDEDCRSSNIGSTMGEPETKICAEDATSDACQGDSGGPLFVESETYKTIVLGIVSSGKSCGDFMYPGVYTKVEKFLDWIHEHTKDAEYCKP